MDVESQVFGQGTETDEKDSVKNNKKADTYQMNKEKKLKEYKEAEKDLLDYLDELVANAPEVPDEIIKRGIAKVHAMPYPEVEKEAAVVPIEKTIKKKRTVKKVLSIAAVVALLGCGIWAFGDDSELNTENGFATYNDGTVKITFFGEDGEEYITVDTLLDDLQAHGYEDIMFPEAFLFDTECRVSVPQYSVTEDFEQVLFDVYSEENKYSFSINKSNKNRTQDFHNIDNAETVIVDNVHIYVFEYDSKNSSINFMTDKYEYYITAPISSSKMVGIAETIK